MNLRECTTFVIDHRQETFSYVFPHTTVVKPIIRPEMVARVAALMQYAGAEIKVIREEDEEKKMRNDTKMGNRTHSVHDMLLAVWNGRADEVNGNALKRLKNDGYIFLDEGVASLSGKGRSFIDAVDAEVANTPAVSEHGARGAKAAAAVIAEAPSTNGVHAAEVGPRRREVPGYDWVDVGGGFYLETRQWPAGEVCNIWALIEGTHEFGWYASTPSVPDAEVIVEAIKAFEAEELQPFDRAPHFAIPIPSANEVRLRLSLYDTIFEALRGSTVFGHLLTPLKAIKDTDALVSEWSGD